MAYRDHPDDDEADLDERDDPDESDMDDGDDPEAVPCPYCRKPVSEDAEICPHCHSFISFQDAPRQRPWWLIAAAVAVLAAILLGLVLSLLG